MSINTESGSGEALINPRPGDWWTRVVLSRQGIQLALRTVQLVELQGAVTSESAGDTYNLAVLWDDTTDKVFVECHVRGQNRDEATHNAIRPLFWGAVATKASLGLFKVENMQLASVEALAAGDDIAYMSNDVTEEARTHLFTLEETRKAMSEILATG